MNFIIIEYNKIFFIQCQPDVHYKMTGIRTDYRCTMGEFKDGIYKGSKEFETLEECQDYFKNDLSQESFVPNKEHTIDGIVRK